MCYFCARGELQMLPATVTKLTDVPSETTCGESATVTCGETSITVITAYHGKNCLFLFIYVLVFFLPSFFFCMLCRRLPPTCFFAGRLFFKYLDLSICVANAWRIHWKKPALATKNSSRVRRPASTPLNSAAISLLFCAISASLLSLLSPLLPASWSSLPAS